MNKLHSLIRDSFLDKHLDLRVRLFNILAMAGVVVSLISAIAAPLLGESVVNMAVYIAFCALAIALL